MRKSNSVPLPRLPSLVTLWSLVLAFVPLLSACQTGGPPAMSVEEAKQVTASFTGASFVPPPRTINDITAILDQQKLADPEAAEQARAKADQPPPQTSDPRALATFFHQRGLAAREIGRARQEIEDLSKALSYARRTPDAESLELNIWDKLIIGEINGGNYARALEYNRQAAARVSRDQRGWLIPFYARLAHTSALWGDLGAADAALRDLLSFYNESFRWTNQRPEWISSRRASVARAQAAVLAARGRYAEAEALQRQAIAVIEADPVWSKDTWLDSETGWLSRYLLRQGRLLEAESEARRALLGMLAKRGRYSTQTAAVLRYLTEALFEQGRYAEAETLARAATDIYQKTGSASESILLAVARSHLASALSVQGRRQEALAEYEAMRAGLAGDPEHQRKYLKFNVGWAIALMTTGQPDPALEILNPALEHSRRLVGDRHQATAHLRGLIAMAHSAKGNQVRALRDFADASQVLLMPATEVEDEAANRATQDRRLALVLEAYMRLLADIRGTAMEQQAGIDAAAEAFRMAEVARGRSVQRALDASAARAAAKTPALADLVRREQDVKKQISALNGLLANVLTAPTDQQDPKVMENLRGRIESVRRARETLSEQIKKEFPAYAELLNPIPATLDRARATLRPGEALITTYVSRDRTYIWAIPASGTVAFAVAPLGQKTLEEIVPKLRASLDPSAKTLGDIPEFDLALAHRIYATLLDPVKSGWQQADSLLVVAHGPLGQLPLALLPTKPLRLAPESGAIFSNYREVPWLVRTHAVTVLPSVASLATLRALPPGDPGRRSFAGFGDPYFSPEQAARAAARESRPVEIAGLATRGMPITLRSSPKTHTFDSSQLAMLPRLPDTAEEIRSIALAMNADLTRDVFLGARANEKSVKTLDLSGYRVLAFATHGLVPGDLDGLTQPALALSAPDVAGVDGDGLLTMEEILGLRLNADWVVLSACNTASGQGTGSEAVSGLGRAFFYAGARALLVSNWPVETTSARTLTTELFRRQQATPGLGRAKAFQQTMNWLIDQGAYTDPNTQKVVFSYAHPIFWAPFSLIGDGGR